MRAFRRIPAKKKALLCSDQGYPAKIKVFQPTKHCHDLSIGKQCKPVLGFFSGQNRRFIPFVNQFDQVVSRVKVIDKAGHVFMQHKNVFAIAAIGQFDGSNLTDIAPTDAAGASGFLPFGYLGIWAAVPFAIWFFLAIEGVPLAAEEAKRVRLARGELGLDIYDMRPRLAEKGLTYI